MVHCRAGSLENFLRISISSLKVHCRAGSLETTETRRYRERVVNCRAGSLKRVCRLGYELTAVLLLHPQ